MFKEHFKNIQSILLETIQNSEKEILIAVAWFTNHILFEAICKKLSEGISVKLIVINDPINNRIGGLDFKKYIKLGGELRFSTPPSIMHHKFCIIDKKTLFNGSYNWTYYAEFKNNENVVHYEYEDDIIDGFLSEYDRLCSKLKIAKRIRPYVVSDEDFNILFNTHKIFLAKDVQYQARYFAKNVLGN